MRSALLSALLGALGLCACATATGPGEPRASFGFGAPDVTMSGPAELLGWYDFERVDLVRSMDPEGLREKAACEQLRERERGRCDLDAAFRYYYRSGTPQELLQRRDAIQDRLMAASEQRCYAYRLQLTRNVSNTNFLLGSATTVLAGAGAVFTEDDVVRALSAAAGITNGVNAEYQRSYLHTMTLQIITRGIEIRRRTIRNEIEQLRGSPLTYGEAFAWNPEDSRVTTQATGVGSTDNTAPRPIAEYTLERAIADALRYHGACTVLSGLEEANRLVENSQSTSLESIDASMQRMLTIVQTSGQIADELTRQRQQRRQPQPEQPRQ